MKKISKLIITIGLLLLMLVFFAVIVFYQGVVNLPFHFIRLAHYPGIGSYLPPFLFWLSVVLLAICLIALLVCLFYPNKINVLTFKKDKGTLKIDKKAIKGFVSARLEDADFMAPPKVKVDMTKHKLKVKINGELKRTSDLYDKTEVLVSEIKKELKELIGVKQSVSVDVVYHGYKKEGNEHSARVV